MLVDKEYFAKLGTLSSTSGTLGTLKTDRDIYFKLFDMYEKEAQRVVKAGLVLPAYDYVLKCSHSFNLLDAAGAISLSERTEYISRVRNLARMCAKAWLKKRKELGFPMLKGGEAK